MMVRFFFFPSVFVSLVIQRASNPCAVFAGKIHTVHTAVLAGYFWLVFPSKLWPLAVFFGVCCSLTEQTSLERRLRWAVDSAHPPEVYPS